MTECISSRGDRFGRLWITKFTTTNQRLDFRVEMGEVDVTQESLRLWYEECQVVELFSP